MRFVHVTCLDRWRSLSSNPRYGAHFFMLVTQTTSFPPSLSLTCALQLICNACLPLGGARWHGEWGVGRSYHECDACHYRYNLRRTTFAVACTDYKVSQPPSTGWGSTGWVGRPCLYRADSNRPSG